MEKQLTYSIVIPVYNEEAVISELYNRLKKVMDSTNETYELIFINDGSKDKTVNHIKNYKADDLCIRIISFSRNFGHQVAITAGMDFAKGKAIVIIDADLQDPPEVIPKMIEKWKEGFDVVYGKRIKRKNETIFKKMSALLFYRILNKMTYVSIPKDTGDFRLIDQKVCNAMKKIQEQNRFVRGLVSWVGFKQTEVQYVREDRYAGATKYPFSKMFRLAINAITTFSDKPLKAAIFFGSLISTSGFLYLFYVLYLRFFTNKTVQGWTSIICIMLIFNGITLLILGIIGTYIGRIYDEAKGRPLYLIDELIGFEKNHLE